MIAFRLSHPLPNVRRDRCHFHTHRGIHGRVIPLQIRDHPRDIEATRVSGCVDRDGCNLLVVPKIKDTFRRVQEVVSVLVDHVSEHSEHFEEKVLVEGVIQVRRTGRVAVEALELQIWWDSCSVGEIAHSTGDAQWSQRVRWRGKLFGFLFGPIVKDTQARMKVWVSGRREIAHHDLKIAALLCQGDVMHLVYYGDAILQLVGAIEQHLPVIWDFMSILVASWSGSQLTRIRALVYGRDT